MICCWVENPNSDEFKQHLPRFDDYFWLSEDGMKAQVMVYHIFKIIGTCRLN
jgi:achilleol B synthase